MNRLNLETENENITSVSSGTKTTSDVYDAIVQLIRVNDQRHTRTGSTGTTWIYTYGPDGNILTKKAYAYTTGTVGTAVESYTYSCGNSLWKDKLTAYNGTAINCASIGNPTGDGTWTCIWEHGRQLKQMTKTGTTVRYGYNNRFYRDFN